MDFACSVAFAGFQFIRLFQSILEALLSYVCTIITGFSISLTPEQIA